MKIKDIAFGIQNFYLFQAENNRKEYLTKINIKSNNKKVKKIASKSREKLKNTNFKKQISKFSFNKKKNIDKINPPRKNRNNIINISNSVTYFNLNKKEKNKKIIKNNTNDFNRLNTTSNINEILNKIGKIMKYNDEELNDLNYNLALRIDKRNYCQYYCSLLKTKHDIFFTFCNNNDYNSKIIKIDLFLFNFALEFTINAFFFTDDTMHKIYEDKGAFNFLYQLPQIAYSYIISKLFNYILKMLALSQDDILDFKSIGSNKNLNKRILYLNLKIKIKLIIYFILSSILILFFWYYISMFCAIYVNTQIHLINDTLISILISLIIPFIINLLLGICRIPSLSNIKNNRKVLYIISKVLQMI